MYAIYWIYRNRLYTRKMKSISISLVGILFLSLLVLNFIFLEKGVIAFTPIGDLSPFDTYYIYRDILFYGLLGIDILTYYRHFISLFLYGCIRFLDRFILKEETKELNSIKENAEDIINSLFGTTELFLFLMSVTTLTYIGYFMDTNPEGNLIYLGIIFIFFLLEEICNKKKKKIFHKGNYRSSLVYIGPFLLYGIFYNFLEHFHLKLEGILLLGVVLVSLSSTVILMMETMTYMRRFRINLERRRDENRK